MARIADVIGRYLYMEVDGIEYRVYYEECGEGTPLICQHTAGSDNRQWRHLLEDTDITDNFRVIAHDLPYHGKSLPPTDISWWEEEYKLTQDFFEKFIVALSHELELDDPVFMGCSMGGHLAADLALNYPDEFRACIALEGAMESHDIEPLLPWLHHPRLSNDSKPSLMYTLTAPQSPEKYQRETIWMYSQGAPAVFKGDLNFYGIEHDITETAQDIDTQRTPLYILSGEYDWSATPEACKALADKVKGSSYVQDLRRGSICYSRIMEFTKLDYCQYLLSSQVNYTLTNLAEHLDSFSHDTINRYLKGEKLSPRLLFEQVEPLLERDPDAYLIFDDTVLDKRFGPEIEPTRYQYSGNEGDVIRGIGVVSLVYVNAHTERFWIIDYRIFDPDTDGKTKPDHVREMLGLVEHRQLEFSTVLMDAWYASKDLMMFIERMGKTFYCPLSCDRQVDDSGGEKPYQRVDTLQWSEQEFELGKIVKVKGFPGAYKLQLFRVVVSKHRASLEWIVTNDPSWISLREAQAKLARAVRWKVEQLHREAKQLTGIERCQCRSGRIQRNHIACSLLVWNRLKELAYRSGRTAYRIKYGLLHDYLVQQLKNPGVQMVLA